MRVRWSAWLLVVVLCAACVGGQPPPPATRLAPTRLPSASPVPPTARPAGDLAPDTPPPSTPTVAATVTASRTPTTTAALITPGSAVSLTQAALIATGKLDQVAWSPDGGRLATAGAEGVVLYDAATLTVTQPLTVGQWATSVAFDPAGSSLAVGTVGAAVQVWSLVRLEPTTLLIGPGVQVAQVAYLPDGRPVLASLGVDNRAHLWNVDGQQYLRSLGAGLRPAHALAFSPDGEWLATAEGDRVLLWSVATALSGLTTPIARSLLAPASRRGAVTAVAFSPAGGQLALANTSGTIELWNPAGTQPDHSLTRLNAPPLALAYSPEGAVLASAHQDRTIRLWDAGHGGALLATLEGHTDVITSLAFSPDGTRLASSSRDGTLRVWAVGTDH